MSDSLRTRIAAVLIAHPDLISGKCHGIEEPELQFDHQDKWAEHVADAVIRELGLVREDRLHPDGSVAYSRYVTGPVAGD